MISFVSPKNIVFWRWLGLLPFVTAIGLYFGYSPFAETMNEGVRLLVARDTEGLRSWGESLGFRAALATSFLMVVQALAAPIPAFAVTATNSLLFGWVSGGILSILSATFAALICFALARLYGEPFVARLVSTESRGRADRFLENHGAATILCSRLLPFVPFDPVSYLAGLSKMRVWTFVWATTVGQIPAGMVYSYLAQKIVEPQQLPFWIMGALFTLIVIGVSARRVILGRRSPE